MRFGWGLSTAACFGLDKKTGVDSWVEVRMRIPFLRRLRSAVVALPVTLFLSLLVGDASGRQRCWACASGCRMTTGAEWYDPNNLLCGCPVFAYCTTSPICVERQYGSMIYCVSGNCQNGYQGTYNTDCGCAFEWLASRFQAGCRGQEN